MGLLRSAFCRSFAIGFALGAAVVGFTFDSSPGNPVVAQAIAAPAP